MNENGESAGPPPDPQDSTVVRLWDRVFSEDLKPGATIDHYHIIGVIGRGGMGVVFEAEQENPRRRVALKVINPGIASPEMLSRFGQETQILGRLQHPGIAQIFEAGTFDLGAGAQPFFAMEFIEGRPLTDFAHAQELNTRQRLELMIRLCEAVQHAHQKGVIHRDLKPGNILVTPDGQPKILDFGVARATDADIQSTTLRTEIGRLIGTIPYMSPEQAAGDPKELDTQSDVYALGVICYELLAGRLPYDLQQRMIHEAVRIIREDDPTPLSSVDRAFRGDIETIVAKALEKEKARRYQSASDLASDIRRYLNDEPIAARPPSTWYQLSKFTRRNRVLVGGIAAVFVALVLGLAGTSYGLKQAIEARNSEAEQKGIAKVNEQKALNEATRADREAQRAKAAEEAEKNRADELQKVSNFQSSMLTGIDVEAMGRQIIAEQRAQVEAGLRRRFVEGNDGKMRKMTDEEVAGAIEEFGRVIAPGNPTDIARTMMDASVLKPAVAAIDRDFGKQPAVDASLHSSIGSIYRTVGLYPAAEPQLRRALELRRKLLGDEHPDVATSLNNLALLLLAKGDYAGAEPLYRESLAVYRKLLGEEHPDVATSLNNLAGLLQVKGDYTGAEPLCREALAMRRKLLGDEHLDVATSLNNLAFLLQDKGDYARAEPLYREALAMYRKLLGDEHPSVAMGLSSLAVLLQAKGDYAGAEPLCREALAMRRRLLGDEHPDVARGLNNLAVLLRDKGDYSGAEPLFREALAMRRRLLGDEHPDVAAGLNNLAVLLQAKGDYAEAEPILREALAMRRKLLGDEHPNTLTSMSSLVGVLTRNEQFPEAEAFGIECHDRCAKRFGPAHKKTIDAIKLMISLYDAWHASEPGKGYDAKAAEWRAKLETLQATPGAAAPAANPDQPTAPSLPAASQP